MPDWWPIWPKFRFRFLGSRGIFFFLFFWVLHYSREDSKDMLGRDLDFRRNISALDSLRSVLDDESESLDRLAAESK